MAGPAGERGSNCDMMTLFHKFFGLIYVLLERREANILICQ
jgi:hypothetical protein